MNPENEIEIRNFRFGMEPLGVMMGKFRDGLAERIKDPENITPLIDNMAARICDQLLYGLKVANGHDNIDISVTASDWTEGDNFLVETVVSDLEKPAKDEYNWHGHNTSQWLYASGIFCTVRNGHAEISVHT